MVIGRKITKKLGLSATNKSLIIHSPYNYQQQTNHIQLI